MSPQVSEQGRERVERFRQEHSTALVTMFFSDFVDSTRLKQKLGDNAGVAILLKHHEMVRSTLREFAQAQEIETAGDSFFIIFVKPSDAVRFALRLQSALRAGIQDESLRVRIGIHLGEVFVQERTETTKPVDYFGTQVDTAARVMSLAQGNQVLCTRTVFDNARQILRGQELEGLGRLVWMNHGEYRLKGVEEPVEVCEIGEEGKAVLSPPSDSEKAWRQVKGDEEEMCGWRPAAEQVVPNTEWVLKARLGEGGFGETWKAENRVTKDLRAFKFCFKAARVRSLKREVTLFRLLRKKTGEHQPFVRLYDVCLDRPPYYLEMEFVDGPNLEQWVRTETSAGRAIPLQTKSEIVAQIAHALSLAHAAGVVHNDVKPTNILMSSGPMSPDHPVSVKLSDFGIGQILAKEKLAELGVTSSGFTQVMGRTESVSASGSRIYMAPELLMGQASSPQSDFYSLGVILYQLSLDDMRAALPADWESNIRDPVIRGDLHWLLRGTPSKRPTDGDAVAQRVRDYAKRMRWRRIRLLASACAALLLLLVAAFVGYALWEDSVSEERRTVAWEAYCASISSARQKIADLDCNEAERLLERCPKNLRNWEWGRLKYLCNLDLKTITGHTGAVLAVACSPEGKRIASGGLDHTVKLWDAETGQLSRSFTGHADSVESVAFSPDGRRIASGSTDRTVKLWDTQTGQEIMTFNTERDPMESVSFSPDGKRIASLGGENLIVWDIQSGRRLFTRHWDRFVGTAVAYSPDGKLIACGTMDGIVILADAQTGQALQTLRKPSELLWSVAFSPDGGLIATGGSSLITLWDVATGMELRSLKGHANSIESVVFSPDGQRLASASDDRTVRTWDIATAHELLCLKGHVAQVNSVAFTPDGRRAVSGGADGAIMIWDALDSREFTTLTGPTMVVTCVAFSPDGKRLAAGVLDGTIWMWDTETRQKILRLKGHPGMIWAIAFSPDGKRLASASDDKSVRVWDTETGTQLTALMSHLGSVNCVAFSADGKRMLTASDDMTAILWDAEKGREMRRLIGHTNSVEVAIFSPDGKRIATAGTDKTVRIWDADTCEALRTLEGHADSIYCVDFDPDGTRLASASLDRTVKVWDTASGKELRTLVGHSDIILFAGFSPDGNRIATGSRDRSVKLWDTNSGREMITLRGHAGAICSVDFSPDGRKLASASEDRTVILWPTADWQP